MIEVTATKLVHIGSDNLVINFDGSFTTSEKVKCDEGELTIGDQQSSNGCQSVIRHGNVFNNTDGGVKITRRCNRIDIKIDDIEGKIVTINGVIYFPDKQLSASELPSARTYKLIGVKLREVCLTGTGNIYLHCKDYLQKNMKLKLSGSGNFNVTGCDFDELDVTVSGAGLVNCNGAYATRVCIKVSGAGSVKGICNVESGVAKVSGVGNIDIQTKNPKNIKKKVTGIGHVNVN